MCWKRRRDRRQFAAYFLCERRLEPGTEGATILAREQAQPLVAFSQHGGQQPHGRTGVVVEMAQNPPPVGIAGVRVGQRLSHGGHVERPRALFEPCDAAEPRRKRCLPREPGAERIDRLHSEARRMPKQLPPVPPVLRQGGRGKLARANFGGDVGGFLSWASASAWTIRSRISACGLAVNVIATMRLTLT
jgi:hypothetical protein